MKHDRLWVLVQLDGLDRQVTEPDDAAKAVVHGGGLVLLSNRVLHHRNRAEYLEARPWPDVKVVTAQWADPSTDPTVMGPVLPALGSEPVAWRWRTSTHRPWHYIDHRPGAILRMRCAPRGDVQSVYTGEV